MKRKLGSWTAALASLGVACAAGALRAEDFVGPADWRLVHTNAVKVWAAAEQKSVTASDAVWPGVVADLQRREVRLLAEAVGHASGVTAEFLLVGPLSDRAYESAAVTVAKPGDIARAVARLGLAYGGGVGSRPFRFWPCGERLTVTVRRLDLAGAPERPLQALLRDAEPAAPLLGEGGVVFAGGRWAGDAAARVCLTDTNMPSSVISLFNEPYTIFDVPLQVGQSEVYGRLTLADTLPFGTLLEFVLRPQPSPDGQPRVLPVTVSASMSGADVALTCRKADGAVLKQAGLADGLSWLRAQAEQGRELFVTVDMDEAMPLKRAADVARVFAMLDGKGLKLDGKTERGLYVRAFLPQEKWRERAGRTPQPFELHVAADASGKITKRLIFIEEDWNVEGLDPKLTPRDYPFESWDELPGLITKAGGADNKVTLLFVYAPAEMTLGMFMPGVRAVADRLPLVYVFCE